MKTAHGDAIPRSACVPSGISDTVVSAAKCRRQDRPVERPAQPFQPADQIDGGADRGEVEPVGRADIAPEHLAEMQRGAEAQGRQALAPARFIEMRHSGPRRGDRAQRRVAGAARRRSDDGKDREHAVADEFQHLAAEGVDRTGNAVEPVIERRDHRRAAGCSRTTR